MDDPEQRKWQAISVTARHIECWTFGAKLEDGKLIDIANSKA